MMITPDWSIKRAMGIAKSKLGSNPHDKTTPPTENLLMRLAFHDCIPYQGGEISGGKGFSFGNRKHIFGKISMPAIILIVVATKVEVLMAVMAASTGKGWTGRGCSRTMRQKGAKYVALITLKEIYVVAIFLDWIHLDCLEIIWH